MGSALSAAGVAVEEAALLSGGAVQENWRLSVAVDGGPQAGRHAWVLRTDAAAVISVSLDRASEFAVLEAAYGAGAPVAKPIVHCGDKDVIGAPFLIQTFVAGTAQARRIARDPSLPEFGATLAAELGRVLAVIHSVRSTTTSIAPLPVPIGNPAKIEAAKYRKAMLAAAEPRPALAYVLAWLARNAPSASGDFALVHGDYRTGNYLIDDFQLVAVLDWEFAHWGDPDEDIGWFCARCWRFGNTALEAGGIAPRAAFLTAYEQAAGRKLDTRRIRYWEVMAAAKWATIALLQGDRYRTGGETSVELALTGLMVSELELEALDGLKVAAAEQGS